MAMGMGNKEALRAHKAHHDHLFGTTPNCHSFAMANGMHPGQDLLPKRAYANPASMPCFYISLDVLSEGGK